MSDLSILVLMLTDLFS